LEANKLKINIPFIDEDDFVCLVIPPQQKNKKMRTEYVEQQAKTIFAEEDESDLCWHWFKI